MAYSLTGLQIATTSMVIGQGIVQGTETYTWCLVITGGSNFDGAVEHSDGAMSMVGSISMVRWWVLF